MHALNCCNDLYWYQLPQMARGPPEELRVPGTDTAFHHRKQQRFHAPLYTAHCLALLCPLPDIVLIRTSHVRQKPILFIDLFFLKKMDKQLTADKEDPEFAKREPIDPNAVETPSQLEAVPKRHPAMPPASSAQFEAVPVVGAFRIYSS